MKLHVFLFHLEMIAIGIEIGETALLVRWNFPENSSTQQHARPQATQSFPEKLLSLIGGDYL